MPAKLKLPRKKDERGGLGPDMDSEAYAMAAEKARKQKEYAEIAKKKFQQQTRLETIEQFEEDVKKESDQKIKIRERIEKAKQFAKQVPKPKQMGPTELQEYIPKIEEEMPQASHENLLDKIVSALEEHDRLAKIVQTYTLRLDE